MNSHSLRPFGSTFSIHLFHFTFWASQNSIKVWLDWNLMSGPDGGFWWFFLFVFLDKKKNVKSIRKQNKHAPFHVMCFNFPPCLPSALSPSALFPLSSIICLNLFPLCFFPSCPPPLPHIRHCLQRWLHPLSVIVPRPPKRRKSNVFVQNSALRLQSASWLF